MNKRDPQDSWMMFACECGHMQVFDADFEDPTTTSGACKACGGTKWQMLPRDEYKTSDHWRMQCLADYVLKMGSFERMRAFLDRFEKRNGKAIGGRLRQMCRQQYDSAKGKGQTSRTGERQTARPRTPTTK